MINLQAPFPWFGGKSRAADIVWSRFGDVPNYVEPFFGSGAVLLLRPHEPRIETVNDKDGFVANFWRAVSRDAEAVARYADNLVNENDLHARHLWLVDRRDELPLRLCADPEYYDPKIAGWWCWGICCWIGGGWCSGKGPWKNIDGIFALSNAGRGVNRQLPHLGNAGQGVNRKRPLMEWFSDLQNRLRRVRVCCGDWSRVCGPSVTSRAGGIPSPCAVLLDPPYSAEADRDMNLYSEESRDVAHDVREWALANGDDPRLRIALCGYDGEHTMPDSWECVEWRAHGGYGSESKKHDNPNARRERIWFSPHCLKHESKQLGLL